jgi:hypothetical protein
MSAWESPLSGDKSTNVLVRLAAILGAAHGACGERKPTRRPLERMGNTNAQILVAGVRRWRNVGEDWPQMKEWPAETPRLGPTVILDDILVRQVGERVGITVTTSSCCLIRFTFHIPSLRYSSRRNTRGMDVACTIKGRGMQGERWLRYVM